MTIWLTGCTSGLGNALVPEFIAAGHTVVGCGRNEIALERLRRKFENAHFFAVDVSDDEEVAAFVEEALKVASPPDLLINNAAVINAPAPLWEVPAEDFNQVTSININGVANIIRHLVPVMLTRDQGIIVNLSSGWGRSTSPEVAPYCASKWAIEGLNQALASELPDGFAAIALNPGIINTEMLKKTFGEGSEEYQSPKSWAHTAAPFLLGLSPSDNGKAMTAP